MKTILPRDEFKSIITKSKGYEHYNIYIDCAPVGILRQNKYLSATPLDFVTRGNFEQDISPVITFMRS